MAVLQMQRVSICALKKDRKSVLEKLQSMGIMEINHIIDGDETFSTTDTAAERQSFERMAQNIDNALELINLYVLEKHSLLSKFEGKPCIEGDELKSVAGRKEELLKIAEEITETHKKIGEAKADIIKCENGISGIEPWLSLDVPLDCKGTEKTAFLAGTMPRSFTKESICELLEGQDAEVFVVHADKDTVYMALVCFKESENEIEEILRKNGFVRPSQICGVPMQAKADFESEIKSCEDNIKSLTAHIEQLAKSGGELKILSDYFRMRAEKYEVLGSLPQSENTFIISGYVAAECVPVVKKAIGEKYGCVIDVDGIKEDEEAPVLLKNNAFSESVEGVLESYGLPKKGEIDPTTIMSFFYVFFFGMMLSDAAYGAILAIGCFVILKKFPRMGKKLHKTLKMFMWCGVSTVVWGLLFGGYFGNVVDIVSGTFFGEAVTVPALWFVPLNDPMRLLVYSMMFGLIHLFTGLAIKGYTQIKQKQYMDFFCDVALWFAFLIGLILMLLPTDIFASIAQTQIVFPEGLNIFAKALAIFGAVGLLLFGGRSSKNIGKRLAKGAYELYNITGWLSDVLSYSRLLALGLATGVIASVVNQMGSMMGGGALGVIVFIVIFIIGHILNLAINLLGAYVHTNRLQYVEFFGKFYEGGGRPFKPFKSETKYIDVKEENK